MFDISPEKRAWRGARWLDRYWPGWAGQLDTDRFDIRSSQNCVWGQLVGHWGDRPRLRLLRREVRLGFHPDPDLGFRMDGDDLTEAWRGEIARRRSLVDS